MQLLNDCNAKYHLDECDVKYCPHLWRVECGYCGFSQLLDLNKEKTVWSKYTMCSDGKKVTPTSLFWDVKEFAFRCKNCVHITLNTVYGEVKNKIGLTKYIYPQLSLEEENILDTLLSKKKSINEVIINNLHNLIKDFFLLTKMEKETNNFKSAVTLLTRKILMHFANYFEYDEENYLEQLKNEKKKKRIKN